MIRVIPRGAASIPIVLVFGILIIAIAVGITAMSVTESIVSHGDYQSARALLFAEAGARDALERIARDHNYSCAAADCYALASAPNGCLDNGACARVSVSAGAGSGTDPKVIVSKGQSGLNARRLQISVLFDTSQYGQIASTTWTELTH